MQQDHYNCGMSALSLIQCFIPRVEFFPLLVVGEHLRLSLLYLVNRAGACEQRSWR